MSENTSILVTVYSTLVTYWYIVPLVVLYILYRRYKSKNGSINNMEINRYKIDKRKLKQKGDEYEAYLCNLYEKHGYTVVARRHDTDIYDQGIDIIATQDKEILFIQCKVWDIEHGHKIYRKDIQDIRMSARDYLEKNPIFSSFKWKIIYIASNDIFDKSAINKIIEHSDEIEHKILPMGGNL